jgi:hypothetical protein
MAYNDFFNFISKQPTKYEEGFTDSEFQALIDAFPSFKWENVKNDVRTVLQHEDCNVTMFEDVVRILWEGTGGQ